MKATLKFRFTVLRFRLLGIWLRISRYKILKFDTEDFDERQEYRRATRAGEVCSAVNEFDQWLRSKWKYSMAEDGTKESIEDAFCYDVRDKLWELMNDEGINFNELIS